MPNYGKLSIICFTDCFGRPAEGILNLWLMCFFQLDQLVSMIPPPAKLPSDFTEHKYTANRQCYEIHLKETCLLLCLLQGRLILKYLDVYF